MNKHKKGFADNARRFTNHVREQVGEYGAEVKLLILPSPNEQEALVVFSLAGKNSTVRVPANPHKLNDENGLNRVDTVLESTFYALATPVGAGLGS